MYQGLWNASTRDFERDIIPMCKDEGMALCPFGAVGAGRFQTEAGYKQREIENPGRQSKPSATDKAVSKVFEEIAVAKGVVLTGVALAYVRLKAPYVFPLIGCRTVEHVKGNAEALKITLTNEEIARIEAASPFNPGFPHTFLSGTLFSPDEAQEGPNGPKDVWLTNVLGTFDWVEGAKPIQ